MEIFKFKGNTAINEINFSKWLKSHQEKYIIEKNTNEKGAKEKWKLQKVR